jgi:hypothetical protein
MCEIQRELYAASLRLDAAIVGMHPKAGERRKVFWGGSV